MPPHGVKAACDSEVVSTMPISLLSD